LIYQIWNNDRTLSGDEFGQVINSTARSQLHTKWQELKQPLCMRS